MHSNKFFILCIYNFEQKNAYWTTEPQANARLAQSVRTAVKQNKVAQLAFKTIKSGFIKIWSLFCELEEEAKHVNETFKCSARNKEIFLLRCRVRLGVKEDRIWQCSHYSIYWVAQLYSCSTDYHAQIPPMSWSLVIPDYQWKVWATATNLLSSS